MDEILEKKTGENKTGAMLPDPMDHRETPFCETPFSDRETPFSKDCISR